MISYDDLRVLRQFVLEGPQTGAKIIKSLQQRSGTVYPRLARFKKTGWIKLEKIIRQYDQPPAYLYALTDDGHKTFVELMQQLQMPDRREHANG